MQNDSNDPSTPSFYLCDIRDSTTSNTDIFPCILETGLSFVPVTNTFVDDLLFSITTSKSGPQNT